MATANITRIGGTDGEIETISSGHDIELPLYTEVTARAITLSADYDGVDELLPDPMTPVRMTRSRAGVIFLSVRYNRLGRGEENVMEPYNEAGIVFPAVHDGSNPMPYKSIYTHGLMGYVWHLPVTHEAAEALGIDIWGYPKVVADIEHTDAGSKRTTSVVEDGQTLFEMTVDRPPTFNQSETMPVYTSKDGNVLRLLTELDGQMGVWPYSNNFSLTLGDHPRAERLRELDIGNRALLRIGAECKFVIHEGIPVTEL